MWIKSARWAPAGQAPPCFTPLSDITARKQAEYALRQSEARMRSIVETGVTILADMLREQKMEPDAPC